MIAHRATVLEGNVVLRLLDTTIRDLINLPKGCRATWPERAKLCIAKLAQQKEDDGWSWAQYGDALLNANRLDEAMGAYENALSFGQGVIAKNGRAEVLKALGQLDKALAAYDAVIVAHSENQVARNARSCVL